MIRKTTIDDLDQLAILFDLYRQFYQQKSDVSAARTFLSERMQNQESVIFVFEENHMLQGFTQLYPTFSSIGLKSTWVLNDLFVSPVFRKKGVAEKLIRTAVNYSKELGSRNLMLQTAVTNVTAQRLYERLGWIKDEQYYSYYLFH